MGGNWLLSHLRWRPLRQRRWLGVKGATRDSWATFCASGEILSPAAAKDVVGSMSQQLRQASQQLSQQLKHVSCVGL
jgi:hypothetical protein